MIITFAPETSSAKTVPSQPDAAPASNELQSPAGSNPVPESSASVPLADLPLADVVNMLQEQQRLDAEERRQAQAADLQARQRFD